MPALQNRVDALADVRARGHRESVLAEAALRAVDHQRHFGNSGAYSFASLERLR